MAGFLVGFVLHVFGLTGEGAWAVPLLTFNFVFSGFSLGVLTFVFTRRGWGLCVIHCLWISTAAAILTNPAWAMALWFLG